MAGVRNSAGVNGSSKGSKYINPLYKSVKSVTSYVGNVAREIRDIPTAIGTSIVEKDLLETRKQLKEAAAAVTAGEKGTNALTYKASGDVKHNKQRK
jgi:hypothetical protein